MPHNCPMDCDQPGTLNTVASPLNYNCAMTTHLLLSYFLIINHCQYSHQFMYNFKSTYKPQYTQEKAIPAQAASQGILKKPFLSKSLWQ